VGQGDCEGERENACGTRRIDQERKGDRGSGLYRGSKSSNEVVAGSTTERRKSSAKPEEAMRQTDTIGDNETDGASFKMLLVTSSLCKVEPAATPHS